MPFLAMAGSVQVELRHRLFDTPCEVTVTLLQRLPGPLPTLASAQLATVLWWGSQMLPLLSSELVWVGVTTTSLETAGGPSVAVDFPTPPHGGIVTRSLTANVAARLNYLVANPPGGLRGCMFLPGVPGNQVSGNTINPAWKELIFDAATVFIDDVVLQGWYWVVESKFLNGSLRAAGVPMRVVTAAITSNTVAQRRFRLHNEVFP